MNDFKIGDKVSVKVPSGVVFEVRSSYSRDIVTVGNGVTFLRVPEHWVSRVNDIGVGDIFLEEAGEKSRVLRVRTAADDSYEVSYFGTLERSVVDTEYLLSCRRLYDVSGR